jgi:hypothetical protein
VKKAIPSLWRPVNTCFGRAARCLPETGLEQIEQVVQDKRAYAG